MSPLLLVLLCSFQIFSSGRGPHQNISISMPKETNNLNAVGLEYSPQQQTSPTLERRNPYKKHVLISAVSFGATWCATLIVAAALDDEFIGTTWIPILGPILTMSRYSDKYWSGYLYSYQKGLLIASSAAQTAFFAYFVWAWINKRDYDHKLTIAPSAHSFGITLRYYF